MKRLNLILPMVIIGIIFSMSIGFSALNKGLSISGEVNYRPENDIRITKITPEKVENTTLEYFDFSKKEVKLAFKKNLNLCVKFTLEITNFSNSEMGILKIKGLDGGVIDGYTLGEKLVGEDGNSKAGMIKKFSITYNSSEEDVKSLLLKFDFEPVYKINYEGFDDTSSFKKEILRNDKLVQNFGDNPPKKVEVTMNDEVITPNYSNGVLTIDNVTGDIKIKPVFYDESGANEPVLSDNMIPVYYDENNKVWKKADKYNRNNNWCDYNNQKWCNAVTVKNVVRDLSGNGNDGEIHGAVIENGEAYFDGKDDYIDTGIKGHEFNQITYIAKFTLLSYQNINQSIIANTDGSGSAIYIPGKNNKLFFTLYDGSKNGYNYIYGDTIIELNKEYLVVAVYDGKNMKIFIDGEQVAEGAGPVNFKQSLSKTLLGGDPLGESDAIGEPSNIKINDVLIFDKALTLEEIKTHYSNKVTLGETKPLIYYDFEETNREIYRNGNIGTTIPMEEINTMWVWIPRYSYTIKQPYGKASADNQSPSQELPGEIDVKFIPASQNDSEGLAQYTGSDTSGWFTPPGFKFGDKDLSGIWIGKFETGYLGASTENEAQHDTQESNKVIIKPDVISWLGIRVSTIELVSMGIIKEKNPFGFNQSIYDSHAIKNSEWALMSYLTQSRYGKYGNTLYVGDNKQTYMNNYIGNLCGCSAGIPHTNEASLCAYRYNDLTNISSGAGYVGAGASTTGNIYGIYDVNGGSLESVMGVYDNPERRSGYSTSDNSGYTGLLDDGKIFEGREWQDDKYYDFYSTDNWMTACDGNPCKGHALNETNAWYNNPVNILWGRYPWNWRSGYWKDKNGGVFMHNNWDGSANAEASFRIVLTPNN